MMHPIENIMKGAMEEIKAIVDVNTIVGDPILTGEETMILPVSKVSLGFISGGGEYEMGSDKPVRKSGTALDADLGTDHEGGRYPFAGAAVAGMSLTPKMCIRDRHSVERPRKHLQKTPLVAIGKWLALSWTRLLKHIPMDFLRS